METDLMTSTARLALHTARQARVLSSVVQRTAVLPDGSRLAESLQAIAKRVPQYGDDAVATTWALAVLAFLDSMDEKYPAGTDAGAPRAC